MRLKDHSITLAEIMKPYFSESTSTRITLMEQINLPASELPVRINNTISWEIAQDPKRFIKTFEFENFPCMKEFIDEVFQYQEETGHHGKIVIEQSNVQIEVHTHTVGDITELDQEYIQAVDYIHDDVSHYFLTTAKDEELYDI